MLAAIPGIVVVVGMAYAYVVFGIPAVRAGLHLTNWPEELVLETFEVCAMGSGNGRITLEVANRSSLPLQSAIFTASTGHFNVEEARKGTRIVIGPIAAGESRRVVVEDDIGVIGRPHAQLYWDAATFAGNHPPTAGPRPRLAQTIMYRDCESREKRSAVAFAS